jgi:hypothetical protein
MKNKLTTSATCQLGMKPRKRTLSHFWLLATLLGGLLLPASSESTDDSQPLKATIQVVSQKYCQKDKGYTIIQNLRVHVANRTSEKIIVKRSGVYEPYVARDLESLSKGVYEYHPNFDWTVEGLQEPQAKAPGSQFAILAPGDSFETEAEFGFGVGMPGLSPAQGSLPPGNHVLQLMISTWDYHAKPEEMKKSWEAFGRLVYKPIKTEPLAIFLPQDPKLETCK